MFTHTNLLFAKSLCLCSYFEICLGRNISALRCNHTVSSKPTESSQSQLSHPSIKLFEKNENMCVFVFELQQLQFSRPRFYVTIEKKGTVSFSTVPKLQ